MLAAVLVSAVALVGGCAATTPPKTAVVYGDSLVHEATPTISAQLAKWDTTIHALPFKGSCDIRAELEATLPEHADRVTIESYSPCQTDGWLDDYRLDLRSMFAKARGASDRVTYIANPPADRGYLAAIQEQILVIAKEEAARAGVRVNLAARDALGGAVFAQSLPCRRVETVARGCVDGMILVRSPDKIHFCPGGYVFNGCPTYSAGAVRFGTAVAAATKAR